MIKAKGGRSELEFGELLFACEIPAAYQIRFSSTNLKSNSILGVEPDHIYGNIGKTTR